jgi:hypothetical protein
MASFCNPRHKQKPSKYVCIVVTYEIRVFFEGVQKEVFSSILKCEYVKYVNTMSKTLNKLSLSFAETQRQRWSSIFKYFQVFFKKPKKTYNTCMFESNWEYVITMYVWQHFETQSSLWIKINFDPKFKWRGLDKINVHKVLTYNFSTTIGLHVCGS